MNIISRLGYICGAILLGTVAGKMLAKTKAPRRAPPPVEKLAEQLGTAWAGYHNR